MDEAHEYINNDTRVPNERINTYLHRLQSNYKWICSGTPYTRYEISWLLVSFLCNLYKLYQSPIGLSVNPLVCAKNSDNWNYAYVSLRNGQILNKNKK